MRRFLVLWVLLGIGLNAFSQQIYFPAKVNHQWAILEHSPLSSKVNTSQLYDNLGDVNLPWFGQEGTESGFFHIEQNGKLGLINSAFAIIVQPNWEEVHPISRSHFLVNDGSTYSIIDATGKYILKGDQYQGVHTVDADLTFFLIKQNGRWGVKRKGQKAWAIAPRYFDMVFLHAGEKGLFKVIKEKGAPSDWAIIDWEGKSLKGFAGNYEKIMVAGSGHLAVQKKGNQSKWSIRDLTGKELLILDPATTLKPLNRDLFAYREKGKNSYSVLVMRKQISPLAEQFSYLKAINGELAFYRLGDKAGFITSNGGLVELKAGLRPDVLPAEGDLLRIKCGLSGAQNRKWGLYSIEKKDLVLMCDYDSIAPFSGNFARVWESGRQGLVNQSGQLLAVPEYDKITNTNYGTKQIYGYFKDMVTVFPVNEKGNLTGEPYRLEQDNLIETKTYYWEVYGGGLKSNPPRNSLPVEVEKEATPLWQELVQSAPTDTLWIKKDTSYWQALAGTFQLMQLEEVEVVIREKSGTSAKKKKSKKNTTTAKLPRQTKMVTKWRRKSDVFKFLRNASMANWTLAYHDNNGLVSNELTKLSRTKFSLRKISIYQHDRQQFLPGLEMVGIRLSDFEQGYHYAAFMDLDGKIGLVDKMGMQVMTDEGTPLRFTYYGEPSQDLIPACDVHTAFSQTGLDLGKVFEEFNVELVKGSGNITRELKSTQAASWGYVDAEGKTKIPFEYEVGNRFENDFVLNQKNGKWGAMDSDQKILIPFEFDAIFPEMGFLKVVKNLPKQQVYYDGYGRRFEQEEHAELSMTGQELFCVQNSEEPAKYGYINALGKQIIPFQYDQATDFINGIATVKNGSKWSFIDEKGQQVIEMDPDIIGVTKVGSFSEGFCPIQKTTILNKESKIKYGYLDQQGKLAIAPTFDAAGKFENGVAVVDSIALNPKGTPARFRALINPSGTLITGYDFKQVYPF